MDHNKEWKLDKESSYSLYKENVVSFLIDKCGLDDHIRQQFLTTLLEMLSFDRTGRLDRHANSVRPLSGTIRLH